MRRIMIFKELKRKVAISCFFSCLLANYVFGQQENTTTSYQADPTLVSVSTPQAAALGKFGKIPVDLFNGLYDMSIPLYSIPVKGHPLNINLSYHSGGVKPNEKGGTVGVGWSLASSGSITRLQNGTADEH